MKQKTDLNHQTIRKLSLKVGKIVPIVGIVIFTVDGLTRPDYSSLHHWVSHLSLGPRGWLGTANLILLGLGLLVTSYGLKRTIKTGPGRKWAPILAALAGLGFLTASVFKQDPGLGYPPGVAVATGSVADSIHGAAALLLFGSLTALCFVMAARYDKNWQLYSRISAWVTIGAFISCSVLVGLDYGKVWIGSPSGLIERIALISVLVYVSVLCYRLKSASKT